MKKEISIRLKELKKAIENESISYGEIAELQSLADYIPEDDNVLKEWAGIPEDTGDIDVGDEEHHVFVSIPENSEDLK